jgi:hypothetical protein
VSENRDSGRISRQPVESRRLRLDHSATGDFIAAGTRGGF